MGRFGKPYLFGGFTPLLKPGFCGLIKGWRTGLGPDPQVQSTNQLYETTSFLPRFNFNRNSRIFCCWRTFFNPYLQGPG